MKFKLKPRKYGIFDFLAIPFQCEPFGMVALGIQKLLTALASIFQVVVTAGFIDSAISAVKDKSNINSVVQWLLLLILCAGWRRISFNIGFVFTQKIQTFTEKNLSEAYADKKARLVYSHIENTKTWELLNRVCNNKERIVYDMLQATYNLILYIIRIVGVLIIIYTQVWWVAILVGVLCVPLIVQSLKNGKKTYSAFKKASEYERRHKYLSEVLSSRDAVNERTLFDYSDHINKDWYEQYEQSRKINMNAEIRWTSSIRAGSAVTCVLSTIIILFLISPTISGQITIGMFIALVSGVYELINLMGWEMARTVYKLSSSYQNMKDLTEFANLEETEGVTDLPEPAFETFEGLEFRNVSFKYPGTDTYILKDLSLIFKPGVHYAFVGINGAGKTTITKLIMGLYDNYEGQILINSKDVRTLTQAQLKSVYSGIFQDFAKYYVTVAQNILLGDVGSMDKEEAWERMIKLTTALNIHDSIMELPKGYASELGKLEENGVDLSGGQWQRVVMARALMSQSPILILDEPTAALDPIGESQLYEQFEKISRGRTTVFISHRLGSTKIADEIFVMDNGKIAEKGSHEVLMNLNGIYARMYESQRSWYE